jgi:hypothetical protein
MRLCKRTERKEGRQGNEFRNGKTREKRSVRKTEPQKEK